MKFTAVVVSHANPGGLAHILGQLRYQTRPPDETLVYVSGTSPAELALLREQFHEASFQVEESYDDWGHEKRAKGLDDATGDFLGFFNDDDSYAADYLERMLSEQAERAADVVYCSWNEQPDCDFHLMHSTAGNFICRAELGREAGYTERVYVADGHFIEALNGLAPVVAKVEDVIYFHNAR